MEIHTPLKDINNLMYHTEPNFLEDTPNQILHMLSRLILWLKRSYTTIGQHPTLYDFLAIAPKQRLMQSTLFKLLAVALRVDLQWTYCCLKQSM